MNNPDFKRECEALEIEETIIQVFINVSKFSALAQKQLSEKTGINKPDISKLKSGNANASIRNLSGVVRASSSR